MKSWTYHNHNIMWPVILVAIAISYVICVLLLSGLQKEDLDPNTLEKLEKRNYDMNNDSLREECLSDAARKSTDDLYVQQKYTSESHLNQQINGNSVAIDNHQTHINSPQFIDTASKPQSLNGMSIKEEILNVNGDAKMMAKIENRHETTNIEHNTDKDVNLNKKSSLEIVLNFWNKIPRQATEAPFNDNKTIDLTRRLTAFVTPTVQHSKENDYVSRIITEYLSTQAASTIPRATTNLSIHFVPENLKHFREQQQKTETSGQLRPFILENNNENSLKNNIDTSIFSSKTNNRDYTPQESLRVYSTPQDNFYNNKQIERHKDIQEVDHINAPNEGIFQNKAALKYLDDILRLRKQFNNDAQSSHSKNRIDSKINNEKQKISRYIKTENNMYKGSSSHEGNGISSVKIEIDSGGVINEQIESRKDIQHIRKQENETFHHWDDILRISKQFNIDAQIPNSEKSSLNKNNNEIGREEIHQNYLLQYISDFQNNDIMNSKKSQGTQSSIDHSGTEFAQVNNAQEERLQNINTVNNKNIPKQAALEYLDNILRTSKKFKIEAEILNSERHNRDRIDCENDQQLPKNDILTYNREIQNNGVKNSVNSQNNKLPNDHFERVSAEVNNVHTEGNNVHRKYIQKQKALQYLDDILRFSKQFNTRIPHFEKSSQIRINNNDKKQKITRNNILPFIPQLQNNDIKNLIKIHSNTTPIDHVGVVSANVINEIAEKVKEIVITDLRREQRKTYELTTHRNTVITTTAPDITSIKDKLTMHQKDTEEKSELGKTLLEILKEYKTLKDRNKSIITSTSNAKSQDKENSTHNENYDLHTNIANKEQRQLNPYTLNSQAIPWNFPEKPLMTNHNIMQTNSYKSDFRLPPITIQTNSDQIAPLAIQLSNPMAFPNHNIILPFVKGEQPVNKQELGQAFATKGKSNRINDAIYTDIKPKAEKNTLRESYKDPIQTRSSDIQKRIQKLQDRIRYFSEHKKQNENTYRPSSTEYRKNTIRGVPIFHSLGQYAHLNHETGSKHRDPYNWEQNLLHRKYPNRPSESKHHEKHIVTNYEENLSRSRNWQHRDYLHQQGDKNPETKPFDYKYLNAPLNSQHRQLLNERSNSNSHEVGPRPRDVATSEILSKLIDSHHRDLLNRLIKSNPTERINRLTDHYRSSDLLKEYIRDEHHPKASKYHEKLEQLENFSSNSNDPYINKLLTQTNCDAIASRQQVPLSVRNYQRTRFDDTHFKNFLKSQQKVTDMLEKILAAKTKPELKSVESV